MSPLTIDRDTREELRYIADNDSGELMDFNLQVGDGNREGARRGCEVAQVVCALLDDLGWAPEDARSSFEITVAPERLTPWLQRMRDEFSEEPRSFKVLDGLLDQLSALDGAVA